MAEQKFDLILDLDKSKEELFEQVNKLFHSKIDKVQSEGQVALHFLLKKKGEKDKTFVYNLSKEGINESEKDFVFPIVVEDVLAKEFNPKIAKNDKLLNHIMGELKKDPYWSDRVVKLITSLKNS